MRARADAACLVAAVLAAVWHQSTSLQRARIFRVASLSFVVVTGAMPQDAEKRRTQRAAKAAAEGRRFVAKGPQPKVKVKSPAPKDAAKTAKKSSVSTSVTCQQETQPSAATQWKQMYEQKCMELELEKKHYDESMKTMREENLTLQTANLSLQKQSLD